MRRRVITGTVAVAAALALLSCTASEPAFVLPDVGVVSIVSPPASLIVGAEAALAASVTAAQDGRSLPNETRTWSSSTPAVATVDNAGRVRALSVGSTTITVTAMGQSASTTLTVLPIPVASVVVSPDSFALNTGSARLLTAEPRASDGAPLTGRTVSWSSVNPAIATVDSAGNVTGVTTGLTTIRATSEGIVGSAVVTVRLPIASITLSPSALALSIGASATVTATPRSATNVVLIGRSISWSSSDAAIATVSQAGVVTAVGVGIATITAESEGVTGSVSITVTDVASVTVSPAISTLARGMTRQYAVTVRNAASTVLTGRAVTWSVTPASVATITATGLLTAVSTGTATIVATVEGVAGSITLTVTTDVASVVVTPAPATLSIGQTAQLSAQPRNAAGTVLAGRTIAWSSSDAAVATVSASGLVTAVSAGSATIGATVEGVIGSSAVTVVQPVASITLDPTSVALVVGATQAVTATLRSATNVVLTGRTVAWSSSDTTVASVNASGVVTAVAAGTATIAATSEGRSATLTATVTNAPVASVDVTPGTFSLGVGQTQQLAATPRSAGGTALTGRTVTWSSLNTAVATVSASGVVTGVSEGSATIRATVEGVVGTSAASVAVPVATITLAPSPVSMYVGAIQAITATLRSATNAILTGRTVSWTTSNAAVATVNASGQVSGVSAGAATITATAEGQSATVAITVLAPVASVTLNPTSATILRGSTTQFTATLRDATGNSLSGRTVTWSSTNTAIATVSASGLVTAEGTGSTTIRATSEGVNSALATITVNTDVASVSITPSSVSLLSGAQQQLTATVRNAAGAVLTGRTVQWSSDNSAVASVNSSGLVTAVSSTPASTVINAAVDGRSTTANVAVTTGNQCGGVAYAVGATVNGSLAVGDCAVGSSLVQDRYNLTLSETRFVRFSLSSSPQLQLTLPGFPSGFSERILGTNFSEPILFGAGTFQLRINHAGLSIPISYTLGSSFSSSFTNACVGTDIALGAGVSFSRSLPAAGSCTALLAGKHDYSFYLAAGQTVTVDLTSAAFNTKLEMYADASGLVAENDDAGAGTNSSLTYFAPAEGRYRVRVTSPTATGAGAYTLSISPSALQLRAP